jgi:hypothetical protein
MMIRSLRRSERPDAAAPGSIGAKRPASRLIDPFFAWRQKRYPKLDYFEQVSGRAIVKTLFFFGWERTGPDWFNICLSIIGIVTLAILGFVAVALDRLMVGAVLIVVSVLALPVVYLWNFLSATFEVDQELRAELEALRKPAWHFDETVAQRLLELLNEGNALIDSQTVAEKRPPRNVWVEDLVSWCTRTQEFVSSHLARREAIGFSSISVFPSGDLSGPQLQNILRVRHNKLRLIAMRYTEAAPKP